MDDSKDDIVTMVDVLNEEKEIDETSKAVLAGSDENKCTYFSGYIGRQALYSCLTCVPDSKTNPEKAIALCLACTLTCHTDHELVELYTKRFFRCDCGVKEGSCSCQLVPTKKILGANPNEKNRYNHNFSGTYCVCKRPYPDLEDPIQDEMIQCIVCEDWYHGRHISDKKIPDSASYSEMICGSCMNKHEFLFDYVGHAVEIVDDASITDTTLNITSLDEDLVDEGNAEKKIKLSEDACTRPTNTLPVMNKESGKFWKDGWRKELCQCIKCTKLYEEHKVEFLCDLEDTTHFYEEKGKAKPKTSIYDSSLAALSSLPRVNQIDAISSYNIMKERLFEYLQSFVESRRIVTEEDIKKFFETMKKTENANVHQPHFCR